MTDEQLVCLYGDPDQGEASQELRRRRDPDVEKAIRCHVWHDVDAEDCLSETWVKVIKNKKRFRPDGTWDSAKRWICSIAHNTALDCGRKARRKTEREKTSSNLDDGASPDRSSRFGKDQLAQALLIHEEIQAAIRTLPLVDQTLVLLHYHGGLNQWEIAYLVGYANAGAISLRIKEILERLRTILLQEHDR